MQKQLVRFQAQKNTKVIKHVVGILFAPFALTNFWFYKFKYWLMWCQTCKSHLLCLAQILILISSYRGSSYLQQLVDK